jgi:hypothetical protein
VPGFKQPNFLNACLLQAGLLDVSLSRQFPEGKE